MGNFSPRIPTYLDLASFPAIIRVGRAMVKGNIIDIIRIRDVGISELDKRRNGVDIGNAAEVVIAVVEKFRAAAA